MLKGFRQVLRIYRRLLIALAVLVAIYAAVGFWLVPYIAKSAIEKYVTQDLGLQLTIKEIRFNPFTLTSEFRGFALSEADNSLIASFDLFRINAQLSSIVYRAWTFAEVRLERPNLNILIAEDGSLNLSKLRPAGSRTTRGPSAPMRVPAVRIATLSVQDGRIGFHDVDRLRNSPFSTTLAPIEFTLSDFRTTPDFQNAYSFEGTTLTGERLAWSGEFSIQPLGSNGRFQITNLKAKTVAAYLGDALGFDLRSGSFDMEGNYRTALEDKPALNLNVPVFKIRDIRIAPKGVEEVQPWIDIPSMNLSRISLGLQERKVAVESIEIEDPKVSVWRGPDGQLNLSSLFGEPSRPGTVGPATSSSWSASIGTVAIRGAAVEAEDRMVQPAVKLNFAPLNLTISNYSTRPGNAVKVELNSSTGGNGRITARGDVSLTPWASNVTVEVTDFDLTPLQPYLAQSTALQITGGRFSLKGTANLAEAVPATAPHVSVAADLTLKNVVARDKASGQNIITWEALEAKGVAYSQNPNRLDIQRVEAYRPYARMIISEERTLNIASALSPPEPPASNTPRPAAAARGTPAKPMPVQVRSVVIRDGSVDFSDHSVEPNFTAAIFGLAGGASGLSSDAASRAEVKLSGTVDRYAPVDITGQVNLLSAALFTDLAANFHNMELTTFNPYSGKYAGYNISKGKLTTELHYKVEKRKLDAQHHIVLDQLEFGAATESKDKVPLPIRLAAALLKDRHGIIDFNFPVSGSLDDPEFRLRPLIWKAFVGLLEKAVTSPFHLLGSLFGRGEEIAFVDFTPGSATLAPDQQEKLQTLAKGLIERPQLRLDIPLQTVSAADDTALAQAQFDAALEPLLTSSENTPDQRLAALAQLYQQQLGNSPAFPEAASQADAVGARIAFLEKELKPRFQPTADQRAQLGRSRADAVQTAVLLNSELAPERVFLTERESGKTAVPGTVRMEFRLE